MRTSNSSIPDLVSFPYVLNSLAVGLVHILILTGSYPDTRSFSAASGFLLQTRWPTLAPTPTAPNFSCVSLKQPGWTENTVRCFSRKSFVSFVFYAFSFSFFFQFSAVVFGSVVEGMDVVKAIEAVGSQSGATRSKVVIASCGQL